MLRQVEEGHLQQVGAARRLRLSNRQVRFLQQHWLTERDEGIVHRLRCRSSNREITDAARKRAVTELRQARYAGFGLTLASEHLAGAGLLTSRETLLQWMRAKSCGTRANTKPSACLCGGRGAAAGASG